MAKRDSYLMSRLSIPVECASLAQAASRLENYPGFTLVAKGTLLRFVLQFSEDHFYMFEISRNLLVFSIFSKESPLYFAKEGILRLLNVLEIISCKFDARVLLPYFELILEREQVSLAFSQSTRQVPDTVCFILAGRIRQLLSERKELLEANNELEKSMLGILSRFLAAEGTGIRSISDICRSFDVKEETVRKAIERLPALGYKAVYRSRDIFEVVNE